MSQRLTLRFFRRPDLIIELKSPDVNRFFLARCSTSVKYENPINLIKHWIINPRDVDFRYKLNIVYKPSISFDCLINQSPFIKLICSSLLKIECWKCYKSRNSDLYLNMEKIKFRLSSTDILFDILEWTNAKDKERIITLYNHFPLLIRQQENWSANKKNIIDYTLTITNELDRHVSIHDIVNIILFYL